MCSWVEDLDNIEEVEELLDSNFVQEEINKYLKNTENAIELISKIIPLTNEDKKDYRRVKKIDNMLDSEFLAPFKDVQIRGEASLQIKLTQISDKLLEQKKYDILRKKTIIGIGGQFSAGKSKFINSILNGGEELLPEDQNPTTSIPTYIVKGNEEISAYTSENKKVSLDVEELQALTHKFYEKYSMGFSSFIKSLFISTSNIPYEKLVFLDTPGYSKPDSLDAENQNELSDENRALEQLRSVDYLIWLVDIENGDLKQPDIEFISKLKLEKPILIVVNKADKKIGREIEQVIKAVEDTAIDKGINLFAVTAYSSRNREEWKSAGHISDFLESSMADKNKEDIVQQICEIKRDVLDDIKEKLENCRKERNQLKNIIFNSDDIMEITSLINLYGEQLEKIHDLEESRSIYQKNMRSLEAELQTYYGRK